MWPSNQTHFTRCPSLLRIRTLGAHLSNRWVSFCAFFWCFFWGFFPGFFSQALLRLFLLCSALLCWVCLGCWVRSGWGHGLNSCLFCLVQHSFLSLLLFLFFPQKAADRNPHISLWWNDCFFAFFSFFFSLRIFMCMSLSRSIKAQHYI